LVSQIDIGILRHENIEATVCKSMEDNNVHSSEINRSLRCDQGGTDILLVFETEYYFIPPDGLGCNSLCVTGVHHCS
jgi:hypothetical protein